MKDDAANVRQSASLCPIFDRDHRSVALGSLYNRPTELPVHLHQAFAEVTIIIIIIVVVLIINTNTLSLLLRSQVATYITDQVILSELKGKK